MLSKHTFKKTHNNLYEKQRFNNIYFLLTLLVCEVICIYYSAVKILAHKPFIFASFSDWPLLIFTLLIPTVLLLVYFSVKLETIFNDDGIFYRWIPVSKGYKMIQWDAIKEITIIELKKPGIPVLFSKEYDRINYIGGKFAVHIKMRSGKKRLIGTNKAERLNRIITRLAGKAYVPTTLPDTTDYSD